MTAPAVGVKLLIFIFEGGFKGSAMQVERDDIRGSKGALGQIGPEEFIDDAIANEPDLPFLFLLRWGWVSGHNDPNERAVLVQALFWTVVERAADPTDLALFKY